MTKNNLANARSLGRPICVNSTSSKPYFDRSFGHFVRVLVDVDLHEDLSYKILVYIVGFSFFVKIKYDKLSEFCCYYNSIGQSIGVCRKITILQDIKTFVQVTKPTNVHDSETVKSKNEIGETSGVDKDSNQPYFDPVTYVQSSISKLVKRLKTKTTTNNSQFWKMQALMTQSV